MWFNKKRIAACDYKQWAINYCCIYKKQLKINICFINWYRPYVNNPSIKLGKLYYLLRKKNFLEWVFSDTLDRIIAEIKDKKPKLPGYYKKFIREADFSNFVIGDVLKQQNKTVGLFSAKLNKCELQYTAIEEI